MKTLEVLNQLNLSPDECGALSGNEYFRSKTKITSQSPIDNTLIGTVSVTDVDDFKLIVTRSEKAFKEWQLVPAPKRGELVRIYGNLLRRNKKALADLIVLEVGKIESEALGEVQEMIDICDMAVGLSRQLFGLTIASERPGHRLMEQWHPLGVIGVISAFNFPMAVWAWNAMLAFVCGNPVIWKPSEKTPYTAVACHKLFQRACSEMNGVPENLSAVVTGDKAIGDLIAKSKSIPLVSATGSVRMGREVAVNVASRLGRSLLELGGNNGLIVAPSADIELAVRAITFSAVGTAGQRCTTLRRIIVHKSIKDSLVERLKKIYLSIKIGSPWEKENLIGPLIDENAASLYEQALELAKKAGGIVFNGGKVAMPDSNGAYVKPAIVEIGPDAEIIKEETFAPILYVIEYENFEEAVRIHNDVPQGLSSAIFTNDFKEAEKFLSPSGSDCGIANVNIGTSGAEVGGAFGGEKETGGGRECGSDVWKNYMRRASNTINYSSELPLAQGVKFV